MKTGLRDVARMTAVLGLLTLVFPQAPASAQGQTGNVCVRDFQGGAVCTANDVRIEALAVVSVVEDCVAGTPGETEVIFRALVSAAGSPDRFDVGLYLALDGNSARDGDSCYHDFLEPPLTTTPTYGDVNMDGVNDLTDGPWFENDGDTCGDIETNTQLFKTLPALRFACIDTNGDGSADVSVCTSWDNNANTACNAVAEAFPGTNSKCSCGGVELGIAPEPAITITKDPANQNVLSGGTANFTFTVTSKTTISNVAVSDPDCDAAPAFAGGDTNNDSILTPDETWTYTCSRSNVMASFMNTVTVTGDGPLGTVNDSDTANVTISAATMTLAKSGVLDDGGDGIVDAGDSIAYTFTVTNTGTVMLTGVSVTDPLPGLSAISCPSTTLAVGASEDCTATLVLSQADVDSGQIDNTATANSNEVGPVQDSESIPLVAMPALTLLKTGILNDGGDGVADVGDTVDYTFQVTNDGNVTITAIGVSDPMVSPIACTGGNPIPVLAAGASVSCTGSYTLLQTDIDAGNVNNTADATGQDPGGTPVGDTDTATTPLPAPAIGVAKRVTAVSDLGGGVFDVSLELVVENLGNLDLTNVQVTDNLTTTFPAPVTFSIQAGPAATGTLTANGGFNGAGDQNLLNAGASTLAIGATGTITLTVRITLNGASGPFSNTAVATASSSSGSPTDTSDNGTDPDPDGDGNPDEPGENDPTPITLTTAPQLTGTKTSTFDVMTQDNDASGALSPGDDLTYTIVLTNSGAGDALAVVFDDTPDANTSLVVGTVTTTQGTVTTGNTAGDTSISISVGTLAAGGGSVTIAFEVILASPFPPQTTQVLNQGTATGSNFTPVFTDDPNTPQVDDPTTDLVTTPTPPTAIPALSTWAIVFMAVLLIGAAWKALRP